MPQLQVRLGRAQDEEVVVVHQAVRETALHPTVESSTLCRGRVRKKRAPILVVQEYRAVSRATGW